MPDFDPNDAEFGSAAKFMGKVRALHAYYGWDERLVLFAAHHKLRGEAKSWYHRSRLFETLGEFEAKLLAAFPDLTSEADVQEELSTTNRAPKESLRTFCHRMIAIGQKCENIIEATVVRHIIKRCNHREFRASTIGSPINNYDELHAAVARYCYEFPERKTTTSDQDFGHKPAVVQVRTGPKPAERTPVVAAACYNCNDATHRLADCPKPRIKCGTCGRHGHTTSGCPSDRIDTVRQISEVTDDSLRKPVIVGGMQLIAYMDGGSKRSLIGKKLAEAIGVAEQCMPVAIKGFGAEPISCDWKRTTSVEVDGQLYHGDIHLVEDGLLDPDDILLGTYLLCGDGKRLVIGASECFVVQPTSTTTESREALDELLNEYAHCFSKNLKEIGCCKTAAMKIEVTKTEPVSVR